MTTSNIRTAFFLDIDNLCGAPLATDSQVREVLEVFEAQFQPGSEDLVFCAATARAAASVKFFRPGFHVQIGRGKDGSDLRLLDLADPSWLKARFDRVVIGSGDGIFSALATELVDASLLVEVTFGRGAMARAFSDLARSETHPGLVNISQLNFATAA